MDTAKVQPLARWGCHNQSWAQHNTLQREGLHSNTQPCRGCLCVKKQYEEVVKERHVCDCHTVQLRQIMVHCCATQASPSAADMLQQVARVTLAHV
jgi:hypothetical protein